MSTLIRLGLTGVILYFVYHETGIWTTVALSLLTVNSELSAIVSKKHLELIKCLSLR